MVGAALAVDEVFQGAADWVREKDVVKLLRTSSSVVDCETTNTEVLFWVARGVGVVQFESFVDGIGKPVLNELISTNVVTLP